MNSVTIIYVFIYLDPYLSTYLFSVFRRTQEYFNFTNEIHTTTTERMLKLTD